MTKTKIVETVEEFDMDGRLLKRTVTETEETDDNPARYTHTSAPYVPFSLGCGPISCEPRAGDKNEVE